MVGDKTNLASVRRANLEEGVGERGDDVVVALDQGEALFTDTFSFFSLLNLVMVMMMMRVMDDLPLQIFTRPPNATL